ncbi:MAG: response regulator [Planctomycetota bacterium]|nr:response regulator [Planctomycetota bacterium]
MDNPEVLSTRVFDRIGVVLVVGSPARVSALVSAVEQLRHTALTAHDATTALATAKEMVPDLALLCVDSLGQQAFDLCKLIKADDKLQDTSVLLVSTSQDPRLQVRAFESGANDILASPRNEIVIGARVRALLKYRNAVRELRAAYGDMELRVAQRTAELRRSNEELKREIAERQKTEAALKTTEEMFRQVQKVEALGQLAGGVAHDFNNILFVILGYCEVLESGLKPDDPLRNAAKQIRTASERAAALTRQLLAFGRRQMLQPQVLDLNAVVGDMSAMVQRLIGEDTELVTNLCPERATTKADRVQLEQVILNLAINARDAMPSGGTLTLETAHVMLAEDFVRNHVGSRPGPHVRLTITDTGCGMAPEVMAHLFEPFYTTKGAGKGTGLGLAMAYGIIKQSGGNIYAMSTPGKGTRFSIFLPHVAGPVPVPAADSGSMPAQGAGTILLVEDDDSVRKLTRQFLEAGGFTVLEARGASEAIMLHERHKEAIQLLLTDVVMPKMSGRDLAKILLHAHAGLRVLFMSGYTHVAMGQQEGFDPSAALLQKPFTRKALIKKVREVLASPPPTV